MSFKSNTIPATRTVNSGCFRNYASDILKANTQKGGIK